MNILFIPLDFQDWAKAKHLTYFFSLGFEEGFSANKINYTTIPTLCSDSAGIAPVKGGDAWLQKARSLCAGLTFDQVWVEIVHNPLSDDILQWIGGLAPIRLALIGESLLYESSVSLMNPHLASRKQMVEGRLEYFTHGLVVDEKDAADLQSRGLIQTFWYPSAVPEKFLAANPVPIPEKLASFSGAVYGKRGDILNDSRFKGILFNRPSLDDVSGITDQFNSLQKSFLAFFEPRQSIGKLEFKLYLDALREIRRESFRLWLRHLSQCSVVVNLPSYYQGYAGRVAEGICAGRPVISWDVQDRPRNHALFIENEEILLFHSDDTERLNQHIDFLLRNEMRAKEISAKALRRMWRFHTMEKRISQILSWLQNGQEPYFGEDESSHSIVSLLRDFNESITKVESSETYPGYTPDVNSKISDLESQLLLDPNNSKLHIDIGVCYTQRGQYVPALNSYLKAIKLGQSSIELWVECARIAIYAKNALIARISLDAVLKLNPNFSEALKFELEIQALDSA